MRPSTWALPLASAVAVPIVTGVLAYATRLTVSNGVKPPADAVTPIPGTPEDGLTVRPPAVSILTPETNAV
jgi:hypothetical protein